MTAIPSRKGLDALTEAAAAVSPVAALGFARVLDHGRVSILYSFPLGIGEFVLPDGEVPDALVVATDGVRQTDAAAIDAQQLRAVERFLADNGVRRVVSTPLAGCTPATRFWVGLSDPGPLTSEQLTRFEGVAQAARTLLTPVEAPRQAQERLQRLELAAGLLPALLHVLDVREVFERLSETARQALPHDLLLLFLFSDDLATFTVYARSDRGSDLGSVRPNAYPAATIRAWEFNIIDDHTRHPLERDAPATRLGARSSLRFPIRFDDRVIGGVAFVSFTPATYTDADVPVGRRLADHVGAALSHYKLAERLADEVRRTEELRARTTNLELLDDLLATLIDSGELPDVFERLSAIARKVLPHDALFLPVVLPDGKHARRYASAGVNTVGLPELIEVPDFSRDPAWEYDLIDDTAGRPEPHNQHVADEGFRSVLRLPIRLDGRFAGVLAFLARAMSAFKQTDVLVARRIADRIAVTLARDREIEASRRADEATERASRLEARVRALTDELDAQTGYRRVVGESREWRQVLTQATQVASTETTALLLGESGTGKEVVARFLHRASPRKGGPFIALNCAALPEQLLEAELFGYERGAFTGATQSKPGQLEQAAGGTLFLDEVGEMSPSAQAKFLRVLQEREFQRLGGTRVLRTDARIVAATNRDLQRAIANGQFREDLYYRLNVFAITLPPLRDRRDDILPLSEAFLNEIGRGLGRPPGGISREARRRLIEYHWPGNVRELRNILERAAILCEGGLITEEYLAINVASAPAPPPAPAARDAGGVAVPAGAAKPTHAGDLQAMERTMIEEALQSARFNKSKAAKALGLTRHQFYIRMRKHGFE
jgi:transcriptional regulator with GAF, ATPase, and Fis domain